MHVFNTNINEIATWRFLSFGRRPLRPRSTHPPVGPFRCGRRGHPASATRSCNYKICVCISTIFLIALLLVGGVSAAERPADLYREAENAVEAGEYDKAEEILTRLLSSEPNNAKYHHLLGDVLRMEGRLDKALEEYEKAKRLGGENAELLKDIGTTQKWMKEYRAASESYKRALELNPKDEEARDDLDNLKLKRGLQLRAWMGGWEPDYTKEAYEVMLSYGGFDKLDLNGGYSYSDQIYYTRDKVYGSGYYFYRPDSYLKLYLAMKDYDYPIDPTAQKPNPDSNSYDEVPVIELEASHWFDKRWRGALIYEFFRPSFFYDKDVTANNHKVTAELYHLTSLESLKVKLIFAILKDPDPDTTEIKGRDNPNTSLGTAATTDVRYRTSSLLGGALEFDKDKWNGGLKYLPNRDLDNSYRYSILADVGYEFRPDLSARLDYVYDKYSSKSNFPGETADVYMVSGFYKLNPKVDIGVGFKYIDLPNRTESTGFLSLFYKIGLGF